MSELRQNHPLTVEGKKDVRTRWGGSAAVMYNGFTPVATSFLWYAAHLQPNGLTPAEIVYVLHLIAYKRDVRAPYPSYEAVAKRMGVSPAYCRKMARSLERKGFLKRTQRIGDTNLYDLTPLFTRLEQHIEAVWSQNVETSAPETERR